MLPPGEQERGLSAGRSGTSADLPQVGSAGPALRPEDPTEPAQSSGADSALPPDGADAAPEQHYRLSGPEPFDSDMRLRVTLLFQGLTQSHGRLIEGAWEGQGFRVKGLPSPDNEALALGREYSSKGMCNPVYYTVGNLLKYLFRLKQAGVPQIEDRFAYVTAGACGPCRFGTYEAEFRRALDQAGFPNLRVILIHQSDGLSQGSGHSGLRFDRHFIMALARALVVGDLLNELGHALRPYEREPGSVDAVLEQGRRWLYWSLRDRESPVPALRRVRRALDEVPIDYLRVKPRVKITGEFWAQTTEGDGNYHMAQWLTEEGAEVMVEPVGTWVEYLLWRQLQWSRDRRGLASEDPRAKRPLRELWLRMGQILFDSVHNTYRAALGFRTEALASMELLARYAQEYYNPRIDGGEAHLEVARTIAAVRKRRAHMVVSVKPFGCMPSTQSDGVQVKVLSDHPDALFVSVETSGDSEVHVKSRIQMVLSEARRRAQAEFAEVAERLELQDLVGRSSLELDMPSPSTPLPRRAIGTAANYLWWLQRPSALRALPVPSEALTDLLRRYRRGWEGEG